MRVPIIAGNWKMYKTVGEAVNFVRELAGLVAGVSGVEIVVCPPFTALAVVAAQLHSQGGNIALGAQNMYWENEGAYTGEIAPGMLKEAGCRYVILGHSERRQYFGETDVTVNKKVHAALAHNLLPIVCVGERLEERESGTTEEVVRGQVQGSLAGLTAQQVAGLVVAYEPVWAIGTGRTASAADAQQVNMFIRGLLSDLFDEAAAGAVRIQYGGSVKPGNAAELMAQPDIDGALVGGASLQADSFAGIIKNAVGNSGAGCQ
ncbi:triose-phosphate isomerase [Desulfoscipio gibsoniae]|uniref:Triosephosphate isomerase n=1 Tax=Desulfoscipio gibsoniae DSM 7213 TaxID=767817 RepID=R4KVB4_9FIRM|nr:triose-phosphate isomerase [Desulfoscipio gibsoniae]AGL03541.1 triosephosphate isomerase [Desulfoscipio gibsoniae DSM 7213]